MARDRMDGVSVAASAAYTEHRKQIADLAIRHRLATLSLRGEFVDIGCLMSYGPGFSDLFRRAATYVDKVLKGAKPADLPVERPANFELVFNLKTAKALGLTMPASVLARADEIIE